MSEWQNEHLSMIYKHDYDKLKLSRYPTQQGAGFTDEEPGYFKTKDKFFEEYKKIQLEARIKKFRDCRQKNALEKFKVQK